MIQFDLSGFDGYVKIITLQGFFGVLFLLVILYLQDLSVLLQTAESVYFHCLIASHRINIQQFVILLLNIHTF